MKIEILDPVDCYVVNATGEEKQWLRRCLSYPSVFYKPGQFKKERVESRTSLLVNYGESGNAQWYFPTGFIPRIKKAAKTDGREIEWSFSMEPQILKPTAPLSVKGVELRPEQLRLVESAISAQRGVLVSPTGSGKTIILMGLLSRFPEARVCIVTHSVDIVRQTEDKLVKHGFKIAHGTGSYRIMVTTRQGLVNTVEVPTEGKKEKVKVSVVKDKWKNWMGGVDIIVIDEVHLFGDTSGQYTSILRSTLASMRIGLTATKPPEKQKAAMALEGMVGPVIDQVSLLEAKELDIIADVELEMVPVRVNGATAALKTWPEMLEAGIINNRGRNYSIIKLAKALVADSVSVIIFVNELKHGDRLAEMAKLAGLETVFVEGATNPEKRLEIKQEFNEGFLGCVISSKVWREGINIPNLGGVILAGGGKSEMSTLQGIGRALRRVEGKEKAMVIDFLDPYRWLAEHTIHRIITYQKQGWI